MVISWWLLNNAWSHFSQGKFATIAICWKSAFYFELNVHLRKRGRVIFHPPPTLPLTSLLQLVSRFTNMHILKWSYHLKDYYLKIEFHNIFHFVHHRENIQNIFMNTAYMLSLKLSFVLKNTFYSYGYY